MQLDITKRCADSLRAFSQKNFGIQIGSSHAHELVAAYFGYRSRASLLADTRFPINNLRKAEYIVLTPSEGIKERRKELDGLPSELPDDIGEGVYLPLYEEKYILHTIWPTLEYLGAALADQHLGSRPAFFRDQKIQREGIKLKHTEDGVRISVYREFISPSLLLALEDGKRGVVDIFELRRVAGHIGYVKAGHRSTEAGTLEAAIAAAETGGIDTGEAPASGQSKKSQGLPALNFSEWLGKHRKRDSPLGDLASRRGFADKDGEWPVYDNYEAYKEHLWENHPPLGATVALERAWKSYNAFLKRQAKPATEDKGRRRPPVRNHDPRTIVSVKNIVPLHYSKRTIEKFSEGDKAWISWEGKKAIPVTVVGADEMSYTFRIERPLKDAGNEHFVRLDEVRSTPELACINHITF